MMFVTPASPTMIVAIAPAFPITAFIRFTLIPAAMIAVVMTPPVKRCTQSDPQKHAK